MRAGAAKNDKFGKLYVICLQFSLSLRLTFPFLAHTEGGKEGARPEGSFI